MVLKITFLRIKRRMVLKNTDRTKNGAEEYIP